MDQAAAFGRHVRDTIGIVGQSIVGIPRARDGRSSDNSSAVFRRFAQNAAQTASARTRTIGVGVHQIKRAPPFRTFIDVRHGADWRASLGRLDNFAVTLDDGRSVPLSAVATVEHSRGLALIPRIDRRRTVTVTGDVDPAYTNANEVLAAVEAEFQPLLAKSYPGISMSFEGQAARQAETGGSMRRVFVIGLIAMFIVLSFQFRSYIEPLIVMLAIPLALTGVVGGHWIMGIDMSMPSMVGFVSLAGIVVNNSILLVVFIRRHLDAGRSIIEAAHNASLDRFRSIFMTTATTVAGLVPLLFETSVQAQVLIPLVTSLAFGLTASTMLVLFLVPALYVILEDIRGYRSGPDIAGRAVAACQ